MGIVYNDQIKSPDVEDEYDAEKLKTLERCMTDFEYFMENFVTINTNKGPALFKPYPFQKEMLEIFSKYRFSCILSSRQSGKCVFKDTKITIRNKKTSEIEHITMEDLYSRYK